MLILLTDPLGAFQTAGFLRAADGLDFGVKDHRLEKFDNSKS
jgi:hypothetical protein